MIKQFFRCYSAVCKMMLWHDIWHCHQIFIMKCQILFTEFTQYYKIEVECKKFTKMSSQLLIDSKKYCNMISKIKTNSLSISLKISSSISSSISLSILSSILLDILQSISSSILLSIIVHFIKYFTDHFIEHSTRYFIKHFTDHLWYKACVCSDQGVQGGVPLICQIFDIKLAFTGPGGSGGCPPDMLSFWYKACVCSDQEIQGGVPLTCQISDIKLAFARTRRFQGGVSLISKSPI